MEAARLAEEAEVRSRLEGEEMAAQEAAAAEVAAAQYEVDAARYASLLTAPHSPLSTPHFYSPLHTPHSTITIQYPSLS